MKTLSTAHESPKRSSWGFITSRQKKLQTTISRVSLYWIRGRHHRNRSNTLILFSARLWPSWRFPKHQLIFLSYHSQQLLQLVLHMPQRLRLLPPAQTSTNSSLLGPRNRAIDIASPLADLCNILHCVNGTLVMKRRVRIQPFRVRIAHNIETYGQRSRPMSSVHMHVFYLAQ